MHSPWSDGFPAVTSGVDDVLSAFHRRAMDSPKFWNSLQAVERHRTKLPHWQQQEATFFVTFRTADSIPQSKLAPLAEARDAWLRLHPRPRSEAKEQEYHRLFTRQIEAWLDAGEGACPLRAPKAAAIVGQALHHFTGQRYIPYAWVVMPNHIHVLFSLVAAWKLEDVVQSWKGFTAREINKHAGRNGVFWQRDYFDRLIRSQKHFDYCIAYILDNPVKAGLRDGEFLTWVMAGKPSLHAGPME